LFSTSWCCCGLASDLPDRRGDFLHLVVPTGGPWRPPAVFVVGSVRTNSPLCVSRRRHRPGVSAIAAGFLWGRFHSRLVCRLRGHSDCGFCRRGWCLGPAEADPVCTRTQCHKGNAGRCNLRPISGVHAQTSQIQGYRALLPGSGIGTIRNPCTDRASLPGR
jgi:hypothetical protein